MHSNAERGNENNRKTNAPAGLDNKGHSVYSAFLNDSRFHLLDLPGCQADLPSEAEWEYACRAGTQTPFSFGANINPQQVNYDGNYPYAGGKRGEYREKTVVVKSLPANQWGLYEMHGNVWEWCKDGQRPYDAQSQLDPLGLVVGNESRVVRGGSWDCIAGWARSAFRFADRPGFAIIGLGFRFCLRSIESGQAV